MELMQELMEKSKVSRKAASAVYHRDYLKTKKKPYRKYDPSDRKKTNEGLEEGMFDFVKGAAQHVGNQVKQGVQNTIAAGQQASMEGQLSKLVDQLYKSLITYNKLKKQSPQHQQQQAAPQQAAPQQAPQQATPAAFRTTQKPRAVMGKYGHEFQFSSYLQMLDNNDFITEGVWDFMKGVGGHMKQGVQQVVQAGKDASTSADLSAAQQQATQTIQQIIAVLQKMGNGALDKFKQTATNVCGAQAPALVQIVLNRAKGAGVQVQ